MTTEEKRKTIAVQYPEDLHAMAKTIATHSPDDETLSNVVADASRAIITRRFKATVEKLNRDLGGES
jgi:hypothetical protein